MKEKDVEKTSTSMKSMVCWSRAKNPKDVREQGHRLPEWLDL
jgi:hypothetical protein